MDELSGPEAADLRRHHRQQGIGGDIERHSEKRVGAALVQLARQPPPGHIELEQHVARRQSHLADLRDVPRRDQQSPRLGVAADRLHHLLDLVHRAPAGPGPRPPLVAIDMVQIAVTIAFDRRRAARRGEELLARHGAHAATGAKFVIVAVGVVVPDVDAVFDEVFYIGVSGEEPQQFVDHPLEEDPLGGQQRKALLQIEAHLVSEDPHRAGSRAVAAHDALRPDAAQQVEVLFHGSSVLSVRRPPSSSTA